MPLSFEWDDGNKDKNFFNHNVTMSEAEEVFFNRPILLMNDKKHSSTSEKRYLALGKTIKNRKLFIVFTQRKSFIRVISARDMTKDENKRYEEHEKKRKKT